MLKSKTAVQPTKSSSVDDSRVRNGLGAKASLPLTLSALTVSYNIRLSVFSPLQHWSKHSTFVLSFVLYIAFQHFSSPVICLENGSFLCFERKLVTIDMPILFSQRVWGTQTLSMLTLSFSSGSKLWSLMACITSDGYLMLKPPL